MLPVENNDPELMRVLASGEMTNPAADLPDWQKRMAAMALAVARRRHLVFRRTHYFARYQNDPVAFGEQVFGVHFTEDIQNVMYSVRDKPVTIARSANGVGKSHCAAFLSVWWYKCFPDSQVWLAAAPPLENLKKILWGEILKIVDKHPKIFHLDAVNDLFIGQKRQKHWIQGITIPVSGTSEERVAKFSGKHAPHLLFILDEGDAIPEEAYVGIDGCTSGGVTRILILFNPKIMSGPVYVKERDRRASVVPLSALNHPNVLTGEDRIPGAVTRDATVARINEWTRPLIEGEKTTGADIFLVPQFLVGATAVAPDGRIYPPLMPGTRKIVEPAFSYKVLGLYPAMGEQQLISEEWVSNARARYDAYVAVYGLRPPAGVRPRMGLDVAEFGTDANSACFRYGGLVLPLISWSGMDTDATARKALQLYYEYNPEICLVDATSLGANVAPSMYRMSSGSPGYDLNNPVRAVGIKASERPSRQITCPLGEFQYIRDQMWWSVREWLRTDPGAMLPPDERLLEELKIPTYSIRSSNGKVTVMDKETMRKMLRRSPDKADSLCLTFANRSPAKVMRAADD